METQTLSEFALTSFMSQINQNVCFECAFVDQLDDGADGSFWACRISDTEVNAGDFCCQYELAGGK